MSLMFPRIGLFGAGAEQHRSPLVLGILRAGQSHAQAGVDQPSHVLGALYVPVHPVEPVGGSTEKHGVTSRQ